MSERGHPGEALQWWIGTKRGPRAKSDGRTNIRPGDAACTPAPGRIGDSEVREEGRVGRGGRRFIIYPIGQAIQKP